MTKDELKAAVDLHGKWLRDKPGGVRLVAIGKNLSHSNLSGSNLRGSDLRGSDLSHSNLSHSNLRGSDLRGSDLRHSNLRGSDLRHSNLRHIRADLWEILLKNKHEARGVLVALRDGRVDGSTYQGDCACLVGTIAKVRGHDVNLPEFEKDASRPAEVWFMSIKKGDTPETNQISAITVDWVEEFLRLLEAA
jgi:hypothetical protein